jgi:hypothetical protein
MIKFKILNLFLKRKPKIRKGKKNKKEVEEAIRYALFQG